MKEGQLRIGNKGEGKHIKIPFQEPETLQEFNELFGENEPFLVQSAMRGVRIKIQDIFRDKVSEDIKAGKPTETIINEVLDGLQTTDITEKKERKAPAPRKPVVVPDQETFSKSDLLALLAQHGIKTAAAGTEEPAATS